MSRPRRKVTVIRLSRRDIVPLKRAAHALVHERGTHFAARYRVAFTRLSIGAARSRWGSCTSKGYIRFNYKIAALPRELAEYIIVHEICHLIELNHSPAFWRHVATEVPQHKTHRAQLRRIAFSFR